MEARVARAQTAAVADNAGPFSELAGPSASAGGPAILFLRRLAHDDGTAAARARCARPKSDSALAKRPGRCAYVKEQLDAIC